MTRQGSGACRSWCARSRTSPSRSAASSARSTMCCRCPRASATTRASPPSMPRSTSCAPTASKARAGDQPALPVLRRSHRSQAAVGRADQGDAAAGRGVAVVLFRAGRQLRLGRAEGRRRRLCRSAAARRSTLEAKVRKLREALEPQASMIIDIPDVRRRARPRALRSLLLKPVEAGWKSAKNLIVVTNGALGLLPLSLLPTAPTRVQGRRAAVRRLQECAVARAHPRRHHGALGRRAAHAARVAARQARRATS